MRIYIRIPVSLAFSLWKVLLEGGNMKLSPPKNITFWVAVLLAVLGVLGALGVSVLGGFQFWLVLAGFVVLALGNLLKGL
jgi:hypothetical protein